MIVRYALLALREGSACDSALDVAAHLPHCYRVIHDDSAGTVVIQGTDVWPIVLHREIFGRFQALDVPIEEIDLSHPIMRAIPG